MVGTISYEEDLIRRAEQERNLLFLVKKVEDFLETAV
jgi:hypothetical protein